MLEVYHLGFSSIVNNFSRVINLLLTKLARDCTGRISALGLFCTVKTSGYSPSTALTYTAAWLAQLVERQSAVREVEGSSPRPDQHSGS